MKKQLEILRAIGSMLNLDYYYNISFDEVEIRLQGHFNQKTHHYLRENNIKYSSVVDDNGYVDMRFVVEKTTIVVILT